LTHGNRDYKRFGFDSGVEFPPHNLSVENINIDLQFYQPFRGNVVQYADVARSYLERDYEGSRVFRSVFPSWDNTARTNDRALVVLNGVPDNYEYWLSSSIDRTLQTSPWGDKLVFINAWNEWAEGCHLEPDRWFGHGFLQATQNAKSGLRRFTCFPETRLPYDVESTCRKFWQDFGEVLNYHCSLRIGKLKFFLNRFSWIRQTAIFVSRVVSVLRVSLSGRNR
jgi:hypothetical protein